MTQTKRWAVLTSCPLPLGVQLGHEDRVFQLPKKPLEDISHVFNEVLSNPQLYIPGIFSELVHQDFNSGLGPVLPVDAFVAQT